MLQNRNSNDDVSFHVREVRQNDVFSDIDTVDWIRERKDIRMTRHQLLSSPDTFAVFKRMYSFIQSWLLIWTIGVSIGTLAGFMDIATSWILDLREGQCSNHYYVSKAVCCWDSLNSNEGCEAWNPWFGSISNSFFRIVLHKISFIIISVGFAVLSALFVVYYMPQAAGSGYTEVKCLLSGFVIKDLLKVRMLLIKSVSVCLALGSGLYIGKEELLIHLACCIGRVILKLFPNYRQNESKIREILSVCSATAVSVAFGAPIGGVLFALEEISYYFPYRTMFRSLFGAMVGSMSLRMMNPYRTGQTIIFSVRHARHWLPFELIIFIQLGVMGGLFGAFYNILNKKWNIFREKVGFDKNPIKEVAIIALITAIIGTFHPLFRLSSARLVSMLFQDCIDNDLDGLCTTNGTTLSHFLMIILVSLARIILPILTYGSSIPGGLFLPSMAVGGCFGRAIGILMQFIQHRYPTWSIFRQCQPGKECITPSTYAIVGAASALGGFTGSTVSLAVIMFELTGALSYMLPIMVSAIVARWVVEVFGQKSLLSGQNRKPLPFLFKDDNYCDDVEETISEKMTSIEDLKVIEDGIQISKLRHVLETTYFKMYPIIEPNNLNNHISGKFYGFVYREQLMKFSNENENQNSNINSNENYNEKYQDLIDDNTELWFNKESLNEIDNNQSIDMRLDNGLNSNQLINNRILFQDKVDRSPITIEEKMPLAAVVHLFKTTGCHTVAIVSRGFLKGLMTKKDILLRCTTNNTYVK